MTQYFKCIFIHRGSIFYILQTEIFKHGVFKLDVHKESTTDAPIVAECVLGSCDSKGPPLNGDMNRTSSSRKMPPCGTHSSYK